MDLKRTIQVTPETYAKIEAAAKSMGMSVEAYIQFQTNCERRGHTAAFKNAVAYAFRKYPKTLRKLSQ